MNRLYIVSQKFTEKQEMEKNIFSTVLEFPNKIIIDRGDIS